MSPGSIRASLAGRSPFGAGLRPAGRLLQPSPLRSFVRPPRPAPWPSLASLVTLRPQWPAGPGVPQAAFATRASKSPVRTADGRLLKPFLLADIGEGITGCEIVKWLVEPGQQVAEFDPIAEVQSDKASVEITSPFEGIIQTLVGEPGQVVKVGEPLCMIIVEPDQDDSGPPSPLGAEQIHFAEEPKKAEDEPLNFIPTQDVAFETKNPMTEIHSTPAVRRLAKENRVDLNLVRGTGRDGRITKEDVLAHMNDVSSIGSASASQSQPWTSSKPPANKRIELGPVQQAMFRTMTQSLKIPHFGYAEEIDVTELEKIRHRLNQSTPSGLTRVTLLSLFVKIMGISMTENDLFRSSLSFSSDREFPQLVTRNSCDISIAVSSRVGLLTPLIPSVESKTVFQIAQQIRQIRQFIDEWDRDDKVPKLPDHLGGSRAGTITLSNIGIIGGTYTHPLMPPTGQLAIAGIGTMKVKPRFLPKDSQRIREWIIDPSSHWTSHDNGASSSSSLFEIQPRLVMNFSFSADHRVVEGTELAKLVSIFQGYCERPEKLLGNLR